MTTGAQIRIRAGDLLGSCPPGRSLEASTDLTPGLDGGRWSRISAQLPVNISKDYWGLGALFLQLPLVAAAKGMSWTGYYRLLTAPCWNLLLMDCSLL